METPKVILSIAGFDPSGGAGVLADIKAIQALGGYGTGVVTAQTVQNTCGVKQVWLEPVKGVQAQIQALFDDLPVTAVKIGMLGADEMAQGILEALERFHGPVVVDPVLKSTSGHPLLAAPGQAFEALLRRADLVTPNLEEARQLIENVPAEQLAAYLGTAVLLKGGHGAGNQLTDTLLLPDGTAHPFSHPRINTPNIHGTGCVLSSAIATLLAQGMSLPCAAEQAIDWLQQQLAHSHWQLGKGAGPICLTR